MASVPANLSPRPVSRPSLRSGGAMVLGLRLAAAGSMFALQFILGRALGVDGFGIYAVAMAWVSAMAVFGRAGLENTSLRQVAEHRTRNELALLNGFVTWSNRTNLIASGLAAAFLIVCTITFVAPSDPLTRSALLLGALAVPLVATRQLQEARLRAVHNVWQSMIGPALWPTLLALFVLVGVVLLGWEATATGAVSLQIAALAVCSIVTWSFIRRSPLSEVTADVTDQNTKLWRRTALTFLAFDAVILLRGRTSVIIAGMMIDTDTAGIYAAAERMSEVVNLGVASINMFAAPHFAALHAEGRRSELKDLIRGSQQLGLLFAIPTALLLGLLGRPLLSLMGPGFEAGYPYLVLMLTSVTVGAIAGPAAYVLAMSGKERVTLHGSMLCMVMNLVLSFSLAPFYGATGLAVTHLLTMIAWTLYMYWHLHQHIR